MVRHGGVWRAGVIVCKRHAVSVACCPLVRLLGHKGALGVGVLVEVAGLVVVTHVVVVGGFRVRGHVRIGHVRVAACRLVVLVLRLEVRRWRHPPGPVDGVSALSRSRPVDAHGSKHHDDDQHNENGEKRPAGAARPVAAVRVVSFCPLGRVFPIYEHVDVPTACVVLWRENVHNSEALGN